MTRFRNIPAFGPMARGVLRVARRLAVILALGPGALLSPMLVAPAVAGGSADLIFADRGPWALGDLQLEWQLDHQGPESPAFQQIRNGRLTLAETTDPSDGQPLLEMRQTAGDGTRVVGRFPVSAGDPVVVVFLENTARDMAMLTGGSPFYIRNRIKDALANAAPPVSGASGFTVELQPFADDPNRDRMKGFETLWLRFRFAEDPSRPIREMVAETEGPVAAVPPEGMPPQPITPAPYRHAMVLE